MITFELNETKGILILRDTMNNPRVVNALIMNGIKVKVSENIEILFSTGKVPKISMAEATLENITKAIRIVEEHSDRQDFTLPMEDMLNIREMHQMNEFKAINVNNKNVNILNVKLSNDKTKIIGTTNNLDYFYIYKIDETYYLSTVYEKFNDESSFEDFVKRGVTISFNDDCESLYDYLFK